MSMHFPLCRANSGSHQRVQPADAFDVVGGEHSVGRVRRHGGEHDRAGHARVGETEDVTDLVQRDGLDVVLIGDRADAPRVLLVVEVQRAWQRVAVEPAPRRVVGVGQHATGHVGVATVRLGPVDEDVGTVARADLPERDLHDGGPRRERTADGVTLAVAGDIGRAGVERVREAVAGPRAGRRERRTQRRHHVGETTTGPRCHLLGGLVEDAARREPMLHLVLRQRHRGDLVEHVHRLGFGARRRSFAPGRRRPSRIGQVPEPGEEPLDHVESVGRLVEADRRQRHDLLHRIGNLLHSS